MKVFLVRHGSTEDIESHKKQFPDTPLSDLGIKQAKAAGRRLLNENVATILTSALTRAKQTAEIIGSEIGKPVEVIRGLHEREDNPDTHGALPDSEILKEHDEDLKKNSPSIDWKFKGQGESLRDVVQRASDFRFHLEKTAHKNIAVVSHSGFIRSFIASCIFGEEYKDLDMLNFLLATRISNAGITLMNFDEDSQKWQIVYLNDHLHL